MIVRTTRRLLIAGPVVAGIVVMIFGTAGSISTTFGIVLIGIGPIVWMWSWLIRMSFDEDDRVRKPTGREEQGHAEPPQRIHHERAPPHPRKTLTQRPASLPTNVARPIPRPSNSATTMSAISGTVSRALPDIGISCAKR